MTLLFSFFFALFVVVTVSHRESFGSNTLEVANLDDIEQGWKSIEDIIRAQAQAKAAVRAHRFPARETCGRKLVMFVLSVCGESCDPKHGQEIATMCCSTQCSEEYIKSACCPAK